LRFVVFDFDWEGVMKLAVVAGLQRVRIPQMYAPLCIGSTFQDLAISATHSPHIPANSVIDQGNMLISHLKTNSRRLQTRRPEQAGPEPRAQTKKFFKVQSFASSNLPKTVDSTAFLPQQIQEFVLFGRSHEKHRPLCSARKPLVFEQVAGEATRPFSA
jgi:hypothetical protein